MSQSIAKAPTGITGLDEITGGGLPRGRPSLVCGSAGSGKTLFASEFLIRGATEFEEPGVLMMFEESVDELAANVRSLGFDVEALIEQTKLVIDHVHIERSEIAETGAYDLEGLFIRLGHAIDSIGAKRVVLDTLEALFAGLPSHAILRAELRRLFRWLKDRGMTAVITGERGDGDSLTRHGLEEYVADCVIVLDQRVRDQVSTRRLRVLKYRGTSHGTNEYPFLITQRGLSVLPITSLRLDHHASTERLSTGITQLDVMLGGRGVYVGSSVLISGAPGTGKSSLSAAILDAACRRGQRAIMFAYEESPEQIIRNMKSIGIDLAPWVAQGLLHINASRPTLHGLEQHLVMMHDLVCQHRPDIVSVDPISNLTLERGDRDVKPTLMRLIDFLKHRQVTTIFTSLTSEASDAQDDMQVGVSSLMDTWLLLRNTETAGERNRTLFVLKSRGMHHSNQVREFLLSEAGIELVEPYRGSERVLTGTARVAQEAHEFAAVALRRQEHEHRLRQLDHRRKSVEAQILALQSQLATEEEETSLAIAQDSQRQESVTQLGTSMATSRGLGKASDTGARGGR
ncbi:MAG TPA: circadian clock protein KaiC [Gemmatimonadaceae bacterium]|nr:circadian clock protein KaiC [Gemmatimonadaceae bacterium]